MLPQFFTIIYLLFDTKDPEFFPLIQANQLKAMMNFVGMNPEKSDVLLTEQARRHFTGNNLLNACSWRGISCNLDGIVHGIQWDKVHQSKCNLLWLPATVKSVRMSRVDLHQELDTRMLPRELKFCRFFNCELFGTPDVRTLPDIIEEVDLERNAFVGTIILTRLPSTLRRINFRCNSIDEVIVRNQALPEKFEMGNFFQILQDVRLVCIDDDYVDVRIQGRFGQKEEDFSFFEDVTSFFPSFP